MTMKKQDISALLEMSLSSSLLSISRLHSDIYASKKEGEISTMQWRELDRSFDRLKDALADYERQAKKSLKSL